MATNIWSRAKNAWNAFRYNKDPTYREVYGQGSYYRPDRPRFSRGNEQSIVTSVYNKIALDVAQIRVNHVDTDELGRYVRTRDSGLNRCLTLEANLDQTGRAFKQDLVLSMFDEGVIAAVPVDTSADPRYTDSYDIESMRVGKILQWYPDKIKMSLYNERSGKKEEIILPKRNVAIIENPLFAVINEPNSVMQRLVRKLNLLDAVDEQSSSGKLDLIIQLPYTIKTELRKQQAEERRQQIVDQLTGSKYGIAYTDGTEKITQLNRPIENNLMKQIEYLTSMLYSQLGITKEIMDGSASEAVMLNYNKRTLEPIIAAIVDEFKRKFISRTAQTRGQSIMFFMDQFKLVPFSQLAECADKFTRNEIMTSNEFRQIIGLPPKDDPEADQLRNKNLNKSDNPPEQPENPQNDENQIGEEIPDEVPSEKGE